MGGASYHGFFIGATVLQGVECPTLALALTWLTDKPVWVDQWPLNQEKLLSLKYLIAEQSAAGDILRPLIAHGTHQCL